MGIVRNILDYMSTIEYEAVSPFSNFFLLGLTHWKLSKQSVINRSLEVDLVFLGLCAPLVSLKVMFLLRKGFKAGTKLFEKRW